MEQLFKQLIEAAKKNRKGLIRLKNAAVTLHEFELASQLRELETKNFPETEEIKYTKAELIFAIQEAYGHGRDEADDLLWHQVEESIRVIIKCIDEKRALGGN
jgi:hypothetical protein